MLRGRLTGLIVAMAVGCLPIAPPEHAHEAEDHGHHVRFVHRHLAHHAQHETPDHEGVLDDDDASVQSLDTVYTLTATRSILSGPRVAAVAWLTLPPGRTIHRTRDYVERPIHGPPRAPTSLRAPPVPSRL